MPPGSSPSSSPTPSTIEWRDYQRFYAFIREVIFPYETEVLSEHSEFHRQIMYYSTHRRAAIAAPRGSLKSTILCRYRPLYRLVDPHPEMLETNSIRVIILSETTRLASEHLAWIKWHLLNNQELIQRYGIQANPDKTTWNEDEIELSNGRRAMALGYESQVRGRHPTDIFVDDLESLKNMGGEESLSKLKDWYYRVLLGAALPETRIITIGTIIARRSLLSELVIKEGWKGRIWKALEGEQPNYRSIWPARWSVDYLLSRKAELGVHRFNAEYQNEPIGVGEPIIMPEWVKRHDEETLSKIETVHRYITVDPAFTEERWGDYSAIIVLDEAKDGRLYERLAWRKKCNAPDLIRAIMSFWYHYQKELPPDAKIEIGIEEVAAQKSLRQSITELDPVLGGTIQSLRPDKDKARRLIDVSRYFEVGIVSLKTESLIDELLSFPMGDKDRVDALVYALKLYEKAHPVGPHIRQIAVDHLKELDHNALEVSVERGLQGIPGYDIPQEYYRNYQESQMISELLEEMM